MWPFTVTFAIGPAAMAESGRGGSEKGEVPCLQHEQPGSTASTILEVVVDEGTPTTTNVPAASDFNHLGVNDGSGSPPRMKLSSQSYRDAVGGRPLVDKYRCVHLLIDGSSELPQSLWKAVISACLNCYLR